MAEEVSPRKNGREPASAKTENLTAYLPWPFHTVLNSTVSSRPEGKHRRVRTGFKLSSLLSRLYEAARAIEDGRPQLGERIKDAGDRREQRCGDAKALREVAPLSKGGIVIGL